MKTEQPEVLEVEVLDLDGTINSTLVKANVTDQVIGALKQKYGNMQLKSVDDKEGYIDIKEARKETRKIGVIVEKICRKGREDAISIQRKWLAKEKTVLAQIAEVQDPLDAQIKKFEDEVERKEIEAAKKREEVWINRQGQLSKLGATYDNGSFVLNHISYEIQNLKEADEEVWTDIILPKYQKQFEVNQEAIVAEENRRKEEADKLRKQQEEFEQQQNAFKEQQRLFENQQRELQAKVDEANRKEKLEQERLELEERKKVQQIRDDRGAQLLSIGMKYNHVYNNYSFEDIIVENELDASFSDETWEGFYQKIVLPAVKEKKDIADKRIADALEKQKQEAIEKAIQDEKVKAQQKEQQRLEDLALSKDKEKYEDVVKYLKGYPVHAFNSNKFKGKMNIIKDFISDL